MSERAPLLPSLYELVVLEQADSAVAEAARRAAAGAEEGTLVWAQSQHQGRGRRGQPWISLPGNLYCAVLLRPEYPLPAALQIGYVAVVSAGMGLAELLSSMIGHRYRWPNDVLLGGFKAAAVTLTPGPLRAGRPEWLIVGLAANVAAHPEDPGVGASSVRKVEDERDSDRVDLLERYSRYFLHWINRWAEEGFAPVRRAWLQRAEGVGEPVAAALQRETVSGRLLDLDAGGNLVLEADAGGRRVISLEEVYPAPPG